MPYRDSSYGQRGDVKAMECRLKKKLDTGLWERLPETELSDSFYSLNKIKRPDYSNYFQIRWRILICKWYIVIGDMLGVAENTQQLAPRKGEGHQIMLKILANFKFTIFLEALIHLWTQQSIIKTN